MAPAFWRAWQDSRSTWTRTTNISESFPLFRIFRVCMREWQSKQYLCCPTWQGACDLTPPLLIDWRAAQRVFEESSNKNVFAAAQVENVKHVFKREVLKAPDKKPKWIFQHKGLSFFSLTKTVKNKGLIAGSKGFRWRKWIHMHTKSCLPSIVFATEMNVIQLIMSCWAAASWSLQKGKWVTTKSMW